MFHQRNERKLRPMLRAKRLKIIWKISTQKKWKNSWKTIKMPNSLWKVVNLGQRSLQQKRKQLLKNNLKKKFKWWKMIFTNPEKNCSKCKICKFLSTLSAKSPKPKKYLIFKKMIFRRKICVWSLKTSLNQFAWNNCDLVRSKRTQ